MPVQHTASWAAESRRYPKHSASEATDSPVSSRARWAPAAMGSHRSAAPAGIRMWRTFMLASVVHPRPPSLGRQAEQA